MSELNIAHIYCNDHCSMPGWQSLLWLTVVPITRLSHSCNMRLSCYTVTLNSVQPSQSCKCQLLTDPVQPRLFYKHHCHSLIHWFMTMTMSISNCKTWGTEILGECWSLPVEGLLSMGPTLSSLLLSSIKWEGYTALFMFVWSTGKS